MKNKKYHFNNKDLEENIHFINEQNFTNISRNNHQYSKKHNFSLPNRDTMLRNQYNILSSEQSTLLSSDDLLINNNRISDINHCNCLCHEIDQKIISKIVKNTKFQSSSIKNNLFYSCPNGPHIHWISYKSIRNDKKYDNRLSRSVGDIKIDYLAEKYRGLNQKYITIRQQLKTIIFNENERNNYIQQLENILSTISNNQYNNNDNNTKGNFGNENCSYRNFIDDDNKTNHEYFYNNKKGYSLLEKTKKVLNYSPYINEYNNNSLKDNLSLLNKSNIYSCYYFQKNCSDNDENNNKKKNLRYSKKFNNYIKIYKYNDNSKYKYNEYNNKRDIIKYRRKDMNNNKNLSKKNKNNYSIDNFIPLNEKKDSINIFSKIKNDGLSFKDKINKNSIDGNKVNNSLGNNKYKYPNNNVEEENNTINSNRDLNNISKEDLKNNCKKNNSEIPIIINSKEMNKNNYITPNKSNSEINNKEEQIYYKNRNIIENTENTSSIKIENKNYIKDNCYNLKNNINNDNIFIDEINNKEFDYNNILENEKESEYINNNKIKNYEYKNEKDESLTNKSIYLESNKKNESIGRNKFIKESKSIIKDNNNIIDNNKKEGKINNYHISNDILLLRGHKSEDINDINIIEKDNANNNINENGGHKIDNFINNNININNNKKNRNYTPVKYLKYDSDHNIFEFVVNDNKCIKEKKVNSKDKDKNYFDCRFYNISKKIANDKSDEILNNNKYIKINKNTKEKNNNIYYNIGNNNSEKNNNMKIEKKNLNNKTTENNNIIYLFNKTKKTLSRNIRDNNCDKEYETIKNKTFKNISKNKGNNKSKKQDICKSNTMNEILRNKINNLKKNISVNKINNIKDNKNSNSNQKSNNNSNKRISKAKMKEKQITLYLKNNKNKKIQNKKKPEKKNPTKYLESENDKIENIINKKEKIKKNDEDIEKKKRTSTTSKLSWEKLRKANSINSNYNPVIKNKKIDFGKPNKNNNKIYNRKYNIIKIEYQENIDLEKIKGNIQSIQENNNNKFNKIKDKKKIFKNKSSEIKNNFKEIYNNLHNNINTFYNKNNKNNNQIKKSNNIISNLDETFKKNKKDSLDNLIGDKMINGNNYLYNENINEINLNSKDNKNNNDKNYKKKISNFPTKGLKKNDEKDREDKSIKYNDIIDKESKVKVEHNYKIIFKKKKKRSLSYNDNIGKILNKKNQKNKIKNINRNKRINKYKIPSLNFLKLNQINKFNYNNIKRNIVLYSNIIKPFSDAITLNDNFNKNIKQININHNYEYDNSNSYVKRYKIFNGRKFIIDLPKTIKNKLLNLNKSCFFDNCLKIGEFNYYIPRSRSFYVGSCFACDLGFSISRSGYSPMTFSPYDKKKREKYGESSSYNIYEQYIMNSKNINA